MLPVIEEHANKLFVFSFLLFSISAFAASTSAIPVKSFCEVMAHPEKYQGKVIGVDALLGYYMEAIYLFDKACDGTMALEFSRDFPSKRNKKTSKYYDEDARAFEEFEVRCQPGLFPGCDKSSLRAVFIGTLQYRKIIHYKSRFAGDGFGTNGLDKARLIAKRIHDVRLLP